MELPQIYWYVELNRTFRIILEKNWHYFAMLEKQVLYKIKTADCLYAVPLMLEKEGLAREVCNHLRLDNYIPDNEKWENMIKKIRNIDKKKEVNIAIVGKYVKLEDSYISVMESIRHAGFENDVNTNIKLIDSETINTETVSKKLDGIDGVIVPGGFGERGIEGMIQTIKYARGK